MSVLRASFRSRSDKQHNPGPRNEIEDRQLERDREQPPGQPASWTGSSHAARRQRHLFLIRLFAATASEAKPKTDTKGTDQPGARDCVCRCRWLKSQRCIVNGYGTRCCRLVRCAPRPIRASLFLSNSVCSAAYKMSFIPQVPSFPHTLTSTSHLQASLHLLPPLSLLFTSEHQKSLKMTKPSSCCGRAAAACVCATQAKCSCGKQAAMQCNCEAKAAENAVVGPRCSCRKSCHRNAPNLSMDRELTHLLSEKDRVQPGNVHVIGKGQRIRGRWRAIHVLVDRDKLVRLLPSGVYQESV